MELKEIEKSIIERTITKITSLATKIRDYCFDERGALTTADFPLVTSIGKKAFRFCSALTDVSFPNVTELYTADFFECKNLKLFIGTAGRLPLVQRLIGDREGVDSDLINETFSELHITGTTLTHLGKIHTVTTKVYFDYADGDLYNFTPELDRGQDSKNTQSYSNLFTDNTTIKNTLMSFADEYTTVTVKHLDGSAW